MPRRVGFANYVKERLLGQDPRFRDDRAYVMYLFLVKEGLALKQSRVTFFRKAKLYYKGNNRFLKEADKAEIEREDLGYSAFKLIRGTPPYFQDKKRNVMAMLRQLGPPNIFLTLSAAEVNFVIMPSAVILIIK